MVTDDGTALGKLVEILFTPANDVYIVRGKPGETLIPAVRDVILSVDLGSRTMTVSLPEGLLAPADENDPDDSDS